MPDFRAYHSPTERDAPTLRLSSDESHHLVVVNRARRGETVVAFDGRGTEWICELVDASKNGSILSIRETLRAKPLPHAITLAQALPKGPSMDAIVRKATELGAVRIVPLLGERTQVHLDDERQDRKIEKWRIATLEAAKQCGNPWLPEIAPLQTVSAFIESRDSYDLKLIASLRPGAKSLKSLVASAAQTLTHPAPCRVLWLIGPEGDFSPAETDLALRSGFEPVTLGPLVLRCETAAIYALAVTSHELLAAAGT